MHADFLVKFYVNIQLCSYTSPPVFVEQYLKVLQQRKPSFVCVRASCRTGCKWNERLRLEVCVAPKALQIWIRWNITYGAPWCNSAINFSRSLRHLMSWKSPCRPSGKSCHKNTSTNFTKWDVKPYSINTHQVLDCCVSVADTAVTLSVSKSASSSPTKWFFARNAEKWGVVLVEIA